MMGNSNHPRPRSTPEASFPPTPVPGPQRPQAGGLGLVSGLGLLLPQSLWQPGIPHCRRQPSPHRARNTSII